MKLLKGLLAAAAFLLCVLFGAGGGCLVSVVGLSSLQSGSEERLIPLAILMTLGGLLVGAILGIAVAVQVWRSFDRRE